MTNKEKGVTLIITFFMMIVILSVILSVSVILYSEVKIIRNMSGAVVSFYAADSGIEKVLYYDRKEVPAGARRGLCAICAASPTCPPNADDPSLACFNCREVSGNSLWNVSDGCEINNCQYCTISFDSHFGNGDAAYSVKTVIFGAEQIYGGDRDYFEITSVGSYYSVGRAINVLTGSGDLGSGDLGSGDLGGSGY